MWILCGFCLGFFVLFCWLVGWFWFGFLILFIFVSFFLLSGTGVSFSTWQDEVIYDPIHSPLHPCGHTADSLRTASEFQLPV